jgi:cobalt/nickel transport protein
MKKNIKTFVFISLIISLILAIFISPLASPWPDGLEKVAEDKGFIKEALEEGIWKFSPIPDYAFPGVGSEIVATALAGLIGTLITTAIGWLIARLIIVKK